MMRKNTVKLSLCLLLACCMTGSIAGCSDKQGEYQETVAIANRYFNRLEYDKAEEYYLKSIEIEPAQQEPYINLYQIYVETERPQQAEQILVQARENLSTENFEQVELKVQEIQKTAEAEAQSDLSDEVILAAYQDALRTLLNDHRRPDGQLLDYNAEFSTPSEFAILDVNENGIPDLLIKYDGGGMVNMSGYIGEFDPESGTIQTIYTGGYFYEPYSNSVLKMDASHNHSYVMEVWPFDLYTWDEDAGKFDWYISVSGAKSDGSDPYHQVPAGTDQDGDGIVFAMTENNGSQGTSSTQYLDRAELEAKVAADAGDIELIPVEYMELNNGNIDSLLAE